MHWILSCLIKFILPFSGTLYIGYMVLFYDSKVESHLRSVPTSVLESVEAVYVIIMALV